METLILLPSPALSACDSLASIEDLDAFLAGCAPLSHFPTPPLKQQTHLDEICDNGVAFEDPIREVGNNVLPIALSLVALVPLESDHDESTALICRFLDNAQLPLEIVAIAANIVAALTRDFGLRFQQRGSLPEPLPPVAALVVVAALAAALSYSEDHPWSCSDWSKRITQGTFSTQQIDSAMLLVLEDLDWRLYPLASLDMVVAGTVRLSNHGMSLSEEAPNGVCASHMEVEGPLKLLLEGTCTVSLNGLVTPEPTPPCSAIERTEEWFLRLL